LTSSVAASGRDDPLGLAEAARRSDRHCGADLITRQAQLTIGSRIAGRIGRLRHRHAVLLAASSTTSAFLARTC